MYFEEGLRNELMSIDGLDQKVFPLSAIEGVTTPYIVFISSEGVHDTDLSGFLDSKEIRCELHILHDSYGSLKGLTREVVTKIKSFQGRVIGGIDGIKVDYVAYEIPHEQFIEDLSQYLCIITLTVRI